MTQNDSTPRNFIQRIRRTEYVYMVYLVIPIVYLAMLPSWQLAILGFILMSIFSAFYIVSYRTQGWRAQAAIIIQIILMLIMILVLSPGYTWLIFFPAGGLGYHAKGRSALYALITTVGLGMVMTLIWLIYNHQPLLSNFWWPMDIASSVGAIAIVYSARAQRKIVRTNSDLRKAQHQVKRLAQDAERERISRDLHDVMGHELSMITLKSQLIARLIDRDPARAKQEIQDVERAARSALARVREYIADIRQTRLEEEWDGALQLLSAAGIQCHSTFPDLPFDEGMPEMQALAMCLREATTNIVRHSRATEAILSLTLHADRMELVIIDNGQGIAMEPQNGERTSGNGLNGIRSRMATVGGHFAIWSNGESKDGPSLINDLPVAIEWPSYTLLQLTVPVPDRTLRLEAE